MVLLKTWNDILKCYQLDLLWNLSGVVLGISPFLSDLYPVQRVGKQS